MSRYIDADLIEYEPMCRAQGNGMYEDCETADKDQIDDIPTADVVEADKVQKEIDYWHDKAQSYEQTILKLSLNKADVVEVVRCKHCKHRYYDRERDVCYCRMIYGMGDASDNNYCSLGERTDE